MNKMQHNFKWRTLNWLRVFCLTLLVSATGLGANAQCLNTSAFGTITATNTPNVAQTISTCSFQSEYSTLNGLLAASTYKCEIATGGFITIRQGTSSGPVIAFGVSPLTWTSTVAGSYFAHWNVNAACGLASTCVVTSLTYVPPPCTIPTDGATGLSLTTISTSQINGSFTAATSAPHNYLVVRYPAGSITTAPVDLTAYSVGAPLGLGTVVYAGPLTTFSATGLSASTTYDFYVYDYNSLSCNGPVYFTTITAGQNTGSATTTACGSLPNFITVGPTGMYPSLTGAAGAITAIAVTGISAPTLIELESTYDPIVAGETYPITIGFSACISATNPLTVYPNAATAAPIVFTSASTTATLDLNGARFVTIDGRPGMTGSSSMISIRNTSTAAAASGNAILLRNDASNNLLTYLDVQAANGNAASNGTPTAIGSVPGAIAIASTTGVGGNDNNTISYCNVHSTGANLGAGIFAGNATVAGSPANNDNNVITYNNIYDMFGGATLATAAVNISLGNNNATVTYNKVYQTAARTYTTAATRGFWITNNTANLTSASGNVISNNYIGGNAANGSGTTAMTMTTGTYTAMDISTGIGAATTIANNTITNITLTGTNATITAFSGINMVNGNNNVTNNMIGSATVNGAITLTAGNLGGFTGIRTGGGTGNTMNITGNTVSGINLNGNVVTSAPQFQGIAVNGATTINVLNNIIGGSLANSINAITATTSASAAGMRGIDVTSGTTKVISGNTISNIRNNSVAVGTAAAVVQGIRCTAGINTVTNNSINNLFQNGQMTGGGASVAMAGIVYTSTTAPATITGNTIHTLKLTHPTTTAAQQMAGILYLGPTTGTNLIAKNFIHSLSIASPNDSNAFMSGMDIGTGIFTVQNNMIRLGIDDNGSPVVAACQIRGLSENAATSNIYNNSVYIGGNATNFSIKNTYAYQRTGTGGIDNVLNNIFVNNRSNVAGGGKHYQAFITTSNLNLTMNYNNYFGNGIGSVFGFNGVSDVNTYSAGWVSTDLNSISGDPIFLAPEDGVASIDMHIDAGTPTPVEQTGTLIASVTDDFDGQVRASLSPNDIGADADNFNALGGCFGTPLSGTAGLTSSVPICGSGSRTMTLLGYVNQPGLSYQWRESATGAPGSFTNVTTGTGGNTIAYTTPVLTTSNYYQCVIKCQFSPLDSNVSTVLNVIVNANASITASANTGFVCVPGIPAVLTASGASTYAWLPAAGLTPASGSPVNALPASNTTYTVTGTDINGCTATATVPLSVNNGIAFTSVTATPSSICAGANSTLAATLAAPSAYCAATNAGSSCITNVTFGALNNTTVCAPSPFYAYYPTPVASFIAGTTYTFTLTLDGLGITSVWIDYNQNGVFETTEWYQPYTAATTGSIPITIPSGAASGQTRMRVRSRLNGNINGAGDACLAMGSGETEDYVINIVGGGSLTYTWTPSTYLSSTTTSPTVATAVGATTTYSVTAVAPNGCAANGTVTVTVDVLNATTSATPSTICLGGSTTVSSVVTGGGLPYTYSWSNGSGVVSTASSFTASPAVTTTYTLTVTDNCSGSTNSVVTVAVDSMKVPLATNSTQCGIGIPAASVATGGTNGSGNFSWFLAPTGGTALQTGTSTTYLSPINGTTNFYVSELGNTGCASNRTLVVATVTGAINVTPSAATLCTGSAPAALVASSSNLGYSYSWAPATGLSATTGASVTANPAATTTYTVTGNDGAGCTNTKTVTVGVFVSPTAPVLTATPGTICVGGTSVMTAVAPSAPPVGYSVASIPYVPASPIGTALAGAGPTGDDATISAPLGFSFNYFGNTYTNVLVHTNGYLVFGTYTFGSHTAVAIPNTNNQNNWLGYHADLNATAGQITYATLGSAPNRRFVVNYNAVPYFAATPTYSGQIILNEASGSIDVLLAQTDASIYAGAVGVENLTGTIGTAAPGRNAVLFAVTNEAWRFSPTVALNFLWTPNGVGSGIASGSETVANVATSPAATTTYTMTLTDPVSGCQSSNSQTVTVIPVPLAPTATGAATPCGASTVTLTATGAGAGTLNWFNVATGGTSQGTGASFVTPLITANTTFYVEENNGSCSGPRTAVLATYTPPAATISASTSASFVCSGGVNNTAVLSVTSSNPNYVYTWTPGSLSGPSVSVTPSVNTIYTVTAIDGPCSVVATVTVGAGLAPTAPIVSATPSVICAGASTLVSAIAPSAPPVGYTVAPITYAPVTPSGPVTVLATGGVAVTPQSVISLDDGTWDNIPLPAGFAFNYYGTTPTLFSVSTNGFMTFGPSGGAFCCTGQVIPGAAAPNNYLALAHEDQLLTVSGTIDYFTNGTAPFRDFVLRFTNVPRFSGISGVTTGQIILHETSNAIDYQVTTITTAAGDNTTMGIENGTGTLATVVAGRNSTSPWTATNEGWRFTPTVPINFSWTPNGAGTGISAGNSTLATTSATPTSTTTYTMTLTDPVNGCYNSSNVTVTVNQPTSSTTAATACGSYVWNGNTYTAAGTYTYTSTNAAGCDSVQTLNLTIACNSVLNLTCFIEGYWDGTSGMVPVLANQGETSSATACDSIEVVLHNSTAPYAGVDSVRTVLNQDGTANCVFGPFSGSYYISVKNRSMVQAWSAAPIAISSTPASYNFTTAESQAYGAGGFPTAMKEVSTGVWAFYSGDIVVDENVDLLDLGLLETDISDFAFGYQYLPININYPGIIATDLNGDGNVDLLDSPIMEDNISNFIFSNHP